MKFSPVKSIVVAAALAALPSFAGPIYESRREASRLEARNPHPQDESGWEASRLEARNPHPQGIGNLLGGAASGLGSVLGGLVGGLGSTLSSALSPVFNGLGSVVGGLGSAVGGVGSLLSGGSNNRPPPQPNVTQRPPPPRPANEPPRPQREPPPYDNGGDWRGPPPYENGPEWRNSPTPVAPVPPPVQSKLPSTLVTTNRGVLCRKYPDNVFQDGSKLSQFDYDTKVEALCYTTSSIPNRKGDDETWLKTRDGCYINDKEVQEKKVYREWLNFCQPPQHWVGILQPQYGREDCYDCPSLDCPSKDLGAPPYANVACSTEGIEVNGNRTWLLSGDQNCFFPAAIFVPNGWLGNPGGRC